MESTNRTANPLHHVGCSVDRFARAGRTTATRPRAKWLPYGPRWLRTALGVWCASFAVAGRSDTEDFTDLSLPELMNIEVTSVSRKAQSLSTTPAAVYVITGEDIRRSGVTSIPDALRLAPGIFVARIDSNKWAVGSRGFAGRFANKLLVLMDGRTVYSPTFSGVYWEVQDTVLDDIDRIEVIRGPGATVWGANAVNGVINIITKSASQTQGGQVTYGAGSLESNFGSLRYGTELSPKTHARAYVKGFDRDHFQLRDPDGDQGSDAWDMLRGGFRVDHAGTDGDSFTLQGDAYSGNLNQVLSLPWIHLAPTFRQHFHDQARVAGWNLLGRWQRALSVDSDLSLQIYYDHTARDEQFLREYRDTFDLDFQHHFALGERHDLIWGLGYRYTGDDYSSPGFVEFATAHRGLHLFSGFVQDEISLVPERLKLTLGTKLEHHDFVGAQVQPSLRLAWTPNHEHLIWGAISRAVRTPSRAEHDIRNNGFLVFPPGSPTNPSTLPVEVSPQGNPGLKPEKLLAFELGHRYSPSAHFSLDSALFINLYDDLRVNPFVPDPTPGIRGGTPFIAVRLPFRNGQSGEIFGAEFSARWVAAPGWVLQANYSYVHENLTLDRRFRGSVESVAFEENTTPEQQWSLSSRWDVTRSVDLDLWLRWTDSVKVGFPDLVPVKPYLVLDARVGWRLHPGVELAVVGQNLLDEYHPEYLCECGFQDGQFAQVPRSVYFKLDWRF